MSLPVEPPAADSGQCQLLGPTALVVQALMGVFVISSLVVKRQLEKSKRPWRIWLLDVGKQLVGQAVLHSLNLLISGLVAIDTHNNPCSAYLLNILIDTTIGVLIIYFALKHATWFFSVYLGWEGYESGQYGQPPQMINWWRQLVPYLISVLIMKLVVLVPLTLPGISTLLLRMGHAAIEYLSPSVQVVFVMAIFPLIMNVVQFCLIDQVIKAGGRPDIGAHPRGASNALHLATRDEENTPSSPLLAPQSLAGERERDKGYGSDHETVSASISRASTPTLSRRGSRTALKSPGTGAAGATTGTAGGPSFSRSRLSEEASRAARGLSPSTARGQSPGGYRT